MVGNIPLLVNPTQNGSNVYRKTTSVFRHDPGRVESQMIKGNLFFLKIFLNGTLVLF